MTDEKDSEWAGLSLSKIRVWTFLVTEEICLCSKTLIGLSEALRITNVKF